MGNFSLCTMPGGDFNCNLSHNLSFIRCMENEIANSLNRKKKKTEHLHIQQQLCIILCSLPLFAIKYTLHVQTYHIRYVFTPLNLAFCFFSTLSFLFLFVIVKKVRIFSIFNFFLFRFLVHSI